MSTHILPAHGLAALPAADVPDAVQARRHLTVLGLALCDVEDGVKEVRLAVLAVEALCAAPDASALEYGQGACVPYASTPGPEDRHRDRVQLTREIMLSMVARWFLHTLQLYTLLPERYARCLKPILPGAVAAAAAAYRCR